MPHHRTHLEIDKFDWESWWALRTSEHHDAQDSDGHHPKHHGLHVFMAPKHQGPRGQLPGKHHGPIVDYGSRHHGPWGMGARGQSSTISKRGRGTASAGSLAFASTDPDIERPARRKAPCGHGTHARHGLCYRAQTNLTPQALWHVRAREPFFEKNYSIGFEVGLRLLSPASKSECNHSDMAAGRLWNKCGDGAAIHINLNWCLALGVCSTLHRHLQHEGGIVAKCRFAHDRRVTLKAAR
jgi:hypothetical protein